MNGNEKHGNITNDWVAIEEGINCGCTIGGGIGIEVVFIKLDTSGAGLRGILIGIAVAGFVTGFAIAFNAVTLCFDACTRAAAWLKAVRRSLCIRCISSLVSASRKTASAILKI